MSASSLSNNGWPRPTGMPRATPSVRAPQESPALRSSSRRASSAGTIPALGAKNGLSGICASSTNGIVMSPSWLIQPTKVVPRCSLSHLRATAPAAARIAQAVLAPVGVVGVAGAEGVEDVAVVLAALVGVANEQRDRRAGG